MNQERAGVLDQMGLADVEFIEAPNGAVIRVGPDGDETMIIPPSGGKAQYTAPVDKVLNQQYLREYEQYKKGK